MGKSLFPQSLSDFKLALRQQSECSGPSSTQEALELCRAVQKFHFQLLVLLGSYIKLVSILDPPMETSPVSVPPSVPVSPLRPSLLKGWRQVQCVPSFPSLCPCFSPSSLPVSPLLPVSPHPSFPSPLFPSLLSPLSVPSLLSPLSVPSLHEQGKIQTFVCPTDAGVERGTDRFDPWLQ